MIKVKKEVANNFIFEEIFILNTYVSLTQPETHQVQGIVERGKAFENFLHQKG